MKLAGTDLREVENIIDQSQEVPAAVLDVTEGLGLAVIDWTANVLLKCLRQSQNSVERSAKLVAHAGQEFVLEARSAG